MESEEDSLDFDISISSRTESFRPSFAEPFTPPPTQNKGTCSSGIHNRLAFIALSVFVLVLLLSVIFLLSNFRFVD